MPLLWDPEDVGTPFVEIDEPIRRPTLPEDSPSVVDCGDSLEPVTNAVLVLPMYSSREWDGVTPTLLVRRHVNELLAVAAASLPKGFCLAVLDAWRTETLQKSLFEYYNRQGGLPKGYVSDPDNAALVPPHYTGGAIDVTLAWRKQPLSLGTDFDRFSPLAWVDALEDRTDAEPARSLRRLLVSALTGAGFCAYPMEWWHFSYGDQVWAHNAGRDHAVYGATSPADFAGGPSGS